MSNSFSVRTEPNARWFRATGLWRSDLLADLVSQRAIVSPAKPAVIDGHVAVSYMDLDRSSLRIAAGLLEMGINSGDVVSVQLPNWWEFAPLMLGIEKLGAIMNPLSPILRRRELTQMLAISKSKVLVVPEAFGGFRFSRMASSVAAGLPSLRVLVVRGDANSPGSHDWESMLHLDITADLRREIDARRPAASALCELAYSSGTTGEPKGILHSHETALATVRSTIERQALGPDEVFHVATPVGHNAGYFYGIRIALQCGGAAVLQDRWDAARMVELVQEHKVSFSMGTTTFLIDLLGATHGKEPALASLRVLTCGGAMIPGPVAQECERRFPGVLSRVFGMTEMGHATATGPDSPRDKVLTTDGCPQPEMEVRVIGRAGAPARRGEEGVLRFRGPFLFMGYAQGRDFTDSHFDSEGYFDTGDLGYQDEDGYIRVTGRVKDIIIRGGENIPVREIEDILMEHPSVASVAIVGVPDDRLGERAVACVEWRSGSPLTLQEVQAFLSERDVARQFWPERLETFDALPRTSLGKIQRGELRRIIHGHTAPTARS